MKNYDHSLFYFSTALKLIETVSTSGDDEKTNAFLWNHKSNERMKNRLLIYMGVCYIDKENYIQARKMFMKGLSVHNSLFVIYVIVNFMFVLNS